MELSELKDLLQTIMDEQISNATYRIIVERDADGGLVLDIETQSERAMIAWAIVLDSVAELFDSRNIASS